MLHCFWMYCLCDRRSPELWMKPEGLRQHSLKPREWDHVQSASIRRLEAPVCLSICVTLKTLLGPVLKRDQTHRDPKRALTRPHLKPPEYMDILSGYTLSASKRCLFSWGNWLTSLRWLLSWLMCPRVCTKIVMYLNNLTLDNLI